MSSPAVSICIPTYNGAAYIGAALDSVAAQTFTDFEVVVSDDRSTDETLTVIRTHALFTEGKVQIVENAVRGIGRNWNNSISNASGTYIKLLFQDDVLAPNCLEAMMEACSDGVAMVWSRKTLIGAVEDGRQAREDEIFRQTAAMNASDIMGRADLYEHPRNPFGEPVCSFFPKSVWEKCPYDNELMQGLDYEHAYRMLNQGTFAYIDAPLVSFRLHANQTTARNKRRFIKDQFLLPKRLLQHHRSKLHPRVVWTLRQKRVTGWVLWNLQKLLGR